MTKPLVVGITGGIGSGKSTIAAVFKLLNVPVYDADAQAKLLMVVDAALITAVKENFGAESYSNGQLNRQYLAEKVFHSDTETQKLNALVHPAVARDFTRWVAAQTTPYVLKEAALLFETGSYKHLDRVILVAATEATRIARVQRRDPQRSLEQIRNIISQQIPVDQARKLADYILENDGGQLIIPQVIEIDKQIKRATLR